MKVYCDKCEEVFQTGDAMTGSMVSCPNCGSAVEVPADYMSPGVVIGDFLIEQKLGGGGMGAVFKARQLSLDREVALKVLLPEFINDTEYIDGLIHEARAAAKLNHPNIVQAYAVGKEDGIFYFAMEFIRGKTYKQILAERTVLTCQEAVKVISEIASALACAWNEQRLVHQDIKPDNIMQDANGFSKLADLGLARKASASDTTSNDTEVMGTPQYISPEQLTGVPTDVRSDIYSLGATFYQFLTGRFPYMAETAEEMAQMHVDGNLEPPKLYNPTIPDEVNSIIVKMMARDIDKRYQTPEELLADLEEYKKKSDVSFKRNMEVIKSVVVSFFKGFVMYPDGTYRFDVDKAKKGAFIGLKILVGAALMVILALAVGYVLAMTGTAPAGISGTCEKIYAAFGGKHEPAAKKTDNKSAKSKKQQKPAKKPKQEKKVEKKPEPKVVKPTPAVTRRQLVNEASQLREFFRDNQGNPDVVLTKTREFFAKYRSTYTDEERDEVFRIVSMTAPLEEASRVVGREKIRKGQMQAIEQENRRQEELDRRKKEREAAEKRIAEERKRSEERLKAMERERKERLAAFKKHVEKRKADIVTAYVKSLDPKTQDALEKAAADQPYSEDSDMNEVRNLQTEFAKFCDEAKADLSGVRTILGKLDGELDIPVGTESIVGLKKNGDAVFSQFGERSVRNISKNKEQRDTMMQELATAIGAGSKDAAEGCYAFFIGEKDASALRPCSSFLRKYYGLMKK
ncbi:MAG: protein kinase [Victivallaceae bacterium]|nr:protein kinase [Victivallaceae bacterium]